MTLLVNPILGPIVSANVHELLCHVLQAIRWHGHLQNGNSAHNESLHKEEKYFYRRTNRQLGDLTRQLVVRSRGSRSVLARLGAPSDRRPMLPPSPPVGVYPTALLTGAGENFSGMSGGGAHRPRTSQHLRRVRISDLAELPDLAGNCCMHGLDETYLVPVMTHVKISAVVDCGTRTTQVIHAAENFHKKPWHDAVLCQDRDEMRSAAVGDVRVVLRLPVGDLAIICEMEKVDGVSGCPMVARGCDRLAWRVVPCTTRIAIRVVPLTAIRRLIEVLPDFADLSQRCGPLSNPPGRQGDQAERVAMRFFVNDFQRCSIH